MSDDCHDPALDNPHAARNLTRGKTCGGCSHNHYSAPFGQALRPEPHSWCLHFYAAIPMHVDRFGSWLRSDIPPGCPTYSQQELFV